MELSTTEAIALTVDGCEFRNIHFNDDGGAIYAYTYGHVSVQNSVFEDCCGYDEGGAMYFDPGDMELRSSCMVKCYLTEKNAWGSVMLNEPDSGVNYISDNSFFGNYASRSGTDGTLFIDDGTEGELIFERDNFTSCTVSEYGAAFVIYDEDMVWEGRYLIFRCLKGESGVESWSESPRSIHNCNFYDNTELSHGVLSCAYYGLSVDSCIFNGNTRDLHIRDYDDIKFFVTNSVFSGPLPNDPWISFGANCYPNSITMSCVIMGGLNHPDCPTNSPKGSLSHPFVQSAEHALLRGFPFPECSRNRSLSLQLQSGRHPLQFLFRILGLARARL